MVGGIVRDKWIWSDGKVEIVVEGTGCESGTFLQQDLAVTGESLTISRGDTVWWQSKFAYWTSQDRSVKDAKIPRVGYARTANGKVCEGRNS